VVGSLAEAAFGRKGLLKGLIAGWLRSVIALIENAWSIVSEGIEKAWSAIREGWKNRKQTEES
jgi:hypothetical protein